MSQKSYTSFSKTVSTSVGNIGIGKISYGEDEDDNSIPNGTKHLTVGVTAEGVTGNITGTVDADNNFSGQINVGFTTEIVTGTVGIDTNGILNAQLTVATGTQSTTYEIDFNAAAAVGDWATDMAEQTRDAIYNYVSDYQEFVPAQGQAVPNQNQCFGAKTRIKVPICGFKHISEIIDGDTVIAFRSGDIITDGLLVHARVKNIFRNVTTEWIELRVPGQDPVFVTPEHRYLRPEGGFAEIGAMIAAAEASARPQTRPASSGLTNYNQRYLHPERVVKAKADKITCLFLHAFYDS